MWNLNVQLKRVIDRLARQERVPDFIAVSGIYEDCPEFAIDQPTTSCELIVRLRPGTKAPDAPWSVDSTAPFCVTSCGNFPTLTADQTTRQAFLDYLPYTLLPLYAPARQICLSVAHMAQTLDGRIATANGDSRWVGNQENLVHAHRMRALSDAVLVGANTVRLDQPRLNVRHVDGSTPQRVVVGGTSDEITACFGGTDEVIHFNERGTDTVALSCTEILRTLFQQGIYTVYIEGGAVTTSRFLEARSVDQLQLHIATKALGSGHTGLIFQGVETMDQALTFSNHHFRTIGDEIMFSGEPVYSW